MPLIKSISGIRGTIGGKPGETLSPLDVVKFTSAFGTWLLGENPANNTIVLGRDGRISGEMVERLVISSLNAVGINVINVGLSTTPTVEMPLLIQTLITFMLTALSELITRRSTISPLMRP